MPTITIALASTVTELQAEPFERVPGVSGQVPQTVTLTAGAGSIVVAATAADWCWRFTEHGPGYRKTRFCTVAGNAAYAALVDLDPGTLLSMAIPSDSAWEAIANAAALAAAAAAPRTGKYLTESTGGDDTTALQAVIDSATGDEIVRIVGTYSTSSMVDFKDRNVDAHGATFNYSGSGLALRIGQLTGATQRKRVFAPRVVCTNKPGTGWTAGTIGVQVVDTGAYDMVTIPHVKNFETGLLIYGQGGFGTTYTNFFLGHLDNNKVNHKLDAGAAGWANQNVYIGGRFSHNSNEGTSVSGTKNVYVKDITANADPNNNLWIGSSFESPGVVEWTIDAEGGSYNRWLHCRYETTPGNPTVRFGATATRNCIDGGSYSELIQITDVPGGFLNEVITSGRKRTFVSGNVGGNVMENNSSNTHPIITFLAAGGTVINGDDPTTGYVGRFTANKWAGKRRDDAGNRFELDVQQGRIYLGDGTAAPTMYIGAQDVTYLYLSAGASLGFLTDNAADIGAAASFRPRYVRCGTAVQTGSGATGGRPAAATARVGAMWFDTTLGKPIWSTGSAWVDATGATV